MLEMEHGQYTRQGTRDGWNGRSGRGKRRRGSRARSGAGWVCIGGACSIVIRQIKLGRWRNIARVASVCAGQVGFYEFDPNFGKSLVNFQKGYKCKDIENTHFSH